MRDRIVIPELLDSLPHDAPDAVRNRRDIRLIHGIMGGLRWTAARVRELSTPDTRWIEIGAGDGPLAAHLSSAPGIHMTGVDLIPRPENWPARWDWIQGDMFDILKENGVRPSWDGLIANFVLHHFEEARLRSLRKHLVSFKAVVINEPVRRRMHSLQSYCLYPLGLNYVTRHDMHVSIRAGFRGRELADWLGLSPPHWDVTIHQTFLGSYRLVAVRNDR